MRARAALVLLALGATSPCRAALGGTADSVEADRTALSAVRRATVPRGGYTVQEVENGVTRLREYVSTAGVVFAVAWDGVARPDLDALLGPYAAAWREAERRVPRSQGRRDRAVVTRNLVVEQWGHMRNLQGRAYDPALLPPEVIPSDIR
jgi:hypothetical protein